MHKLLSSSTFLTAAMVVVFGLTTDLRAQEPAKSGQEDASAMVRADVRLDQPTVLVGQKIWATFTITSLLEEAVGLQAPGAQLAEMPSTEVGLPLQHVFSGKNFTGLTIEDDRGVISGENVFHKPTAPVPPVTLAGHASVGLRVELGQYYDIFRRPGVYKLVWKPYQEIVRSEPVTVTVLARQRAKVITDFGPITMEFFYEVAPNHVRNFVELVKDQFYDNLTFHRLVAGGLIQGGAPRGDPKGGRPDGKTVKAEFSKIPFEMGTVGMCHLPQNPDSASSQFFICLSAQPGFVGNQTAFGKVVGSESFETLKKIASLPTDAKERPLQPVAIRTISLENIPDRTRETVPMAVAGEGAVPRTGVVRLNNPGSVNAKAPPAESAPAVGPKPATSQPETRASQ